MRVEIIFVATFGSVGCVALVAREGDGGLGEIVAGACRASVVVSSFLL